MITNANLTLYNRIELRNEVTWYKTEIYGVNWQDKSKSTVGENGLLTAKSTKIFIPFSSIIGKEYLEPITFFNAEDQSSKFTFNEGDIVVRGISPYDLSAGSEKELRRGYDNVLTILNVDTNDNGGYSMKHFELEAK